ncbi:phospholipase D-like domain-containing protein [Polyangium sp. y55x31]|uniref:phospholipase D-like domain-containing protein n=1 Tax=Polyangium sp. y55x31 TaxID=3042688 RepID=UPI0024829E8F|nr:phospholipase D-like domain-containing protein [Polyangium sp. y55x31]MDI1476084.1 phospholipase D-like domain-containing protein [Polyangium sp. y55x31]
MTWFVEGLPVTAGNNVQIYLDGQEYCQDLYLAIRNARRSVFLTGLHFMADFRLVRGHLPRADMKTELASVLAEAGMRGVSVYLLVNQFWSDEDDVRRRMASTEVGGGMLLGMINLETWREGLRQFLIEEGGLHNYLGETYKLFSALKGVPNVTCRTDIHPKTGTFGTHHQKTVVIDGEVAFLGGIDLTYIDGDRWDTRIHDTAHRNSSRTEKYWHDIHCRIRGPAVDFVRDNFIQRWNHGNLHWLSKDATGAILAKPVRDGSERPALAAFHRAKPYPAPTGDEPGLVQIVRSMPAHYAREGKPAWSKSGEDWERSCKDAYLLGIKAAKRYIYLENQWVSDEHIWAALAESAQKNRQNPDFRIIVMLPNKPLAAAGFGANQDVDHSDEIRRVATHIGDRFGMYSLLQPYPANSTAGVAQVYVHSKILIVDDCWALIGSANAGGISLEGHRPGADGPDTELSAIILDKKLVSDFRRRLWTEHLRSPVSAEYLSHEADRFRVIARRRGGGGHKLRFFPVYDHVRGWSGASIPMSSLWERTAEKKSVIVPSFPEGLASALPIGSIRPSFRVRLQPAPPSFDDQCLYRWRCYLFDRLLEGEPTRIEMRSLDGGEVDDFTVHDAACISDAGARQIEGRMQDEAWGAIECRVGLVPWKASGRPERGFSVIYLCRFISRHRVAELSQAMRQLLSFWKP